MGLADAVDRSSLTVEVVKCEICLLPLFSTMTHDQPLEKLSYSELMDRIDESVVWNEFVARYHSRLDTFRNWYERNRIRGGAITFDDVLQNMLRPSENKPYGYLQRALVDTRPPTEQDFLKFAKYKFRHRLIDEARRETKHQLVVALEYAGDLPHQQPHGLASMEIWQIIRDAVNQLDEVERMAVRLYYGVQGSESEIPEPPRPIKEVVQELDDAHGIEVTYEQVKEKLKQARKLLKKELQAKGITLSEQDVDDKINKAQRLLGIVLLPFEEGLDED